MDGARVNYLHPAVSADAFSSAMLRRVGGRDGCVDAGDVNRGRASVSADLGGSSKYSSENLED